MSEIINEFVCEFDQSLYPSVPLAAGLSEQDFRDGDDNPHFITLPLLHVGARSKNPGTGTWTKEAVERVSQEINSKRPEGNTGHVRPEDRHWKYNFGKLRWVGSLVEKDTLYAKAYISPSSQETRDYFRTAAISKSRVGTSISGSKGPRNRLEEIEVHTIDLGHPDRLGTAAAAALPQLTNELEQGELNMAEQTAANETANVKENLVAEMLHLGDDHIKGANDLVNELVDLRKKEATLASIIDEFDLGENPLEKMKGLATELASFRKQNLVNELDQSLSEKVSVEPLRPYIRKMLMRGGEMVDETIEDANNRIDELLKDEDIQHLSGLLTREQRGPNSFASTQVLDGRGKFEPTMQDQMAVARDLGINVG